MFKAIMVIFLVSVGYPPKDYTRSGDLDVVMFETIEQCNFAKAQMERIMGTWGSGQGENRVLLDVKKSIECIEFPEELVSTPFNVEVVDGEPRIVAQEKEERPHKRWND